MIINDFDNSIQYHQFSKEYLQCNPAKYSSAGIKTKICSYVEFSYNSLQTASFRILVFFNCLFQVKLKINIFLHTERYESLLNS